MDYETLRNHYLSNFQTTVKNNNQIFKNKIFKKFIKTLLNIWLEFSKKIIPCTLLNKIYIKCLMDTIRNQKGVYITHIKNERRKGKKHLRVKRIIWGEKYHIKKNSNDDKK